MICREKEPQSAVGAKTEIALDDPLYLLCQGSNSWVDEIGKDVTKEIREQ